ncbi:hypothetical protein AM593_04161, partial [Mytilus galloprovincialis]
MNMTLKLKKGHRCPKTTYQTNGDIKRCIAVGEYHCQNSHSVLSSGVMGNWYHDYNEDDNDGMFNDLDRLYNPQLTMQNVTFHNAEQTWKNAANFCSSKGGVLESNVTLLREQDELKDANNDVWLGKFRTLTNWTYIRDRLPDFGTTDITKKCIAALHCVHGKIKRSSEKCETRYYVTCDNDVELGYDYGTYQDAVEECERQGSFIKWYSYWTSGTRHDEIFVIRKAWTDEDKGDLISIPNLSIVPQNNAESNNWGSIAAGTITSTIVLIVAILTKRASDVNILVTMMTNQSTIRFRLSKKKPTIHKSQNSCPVQDLDELHINNESIQTAIDHEIDGENNSPPYEILNRYPAVNSSSYDCLN